MIVAVGPSGSDYSTDGGASWVSLGKEGYHAISFAQSTAGWAVGEGGRIAKYGGASDARKRKKNRRPGAD